MDIIYCISPTYLEAMFKESDQFGFYIQGYGDFDKAFKGLIKSNMSNIKGFAILLNELPEDLSSIIYFINFIDSLKLNKTVVLALQDSTGLDVLLENINKDNLEMYLVDDIDIITDRVIMTDIFGTILKSFLRPYAKSLYTDIEEEYFDFTETSSISYTPLFNKNIQSAMEDFDEVGSFDRTVKMDSNLDKIKHNPVLHAIRLYSMSLRLGYNIDLYRDKLIIALEEYEDDVDIHKYRAMVLVAEQGGI